MAADDLRGVIDQMKLMQISIESLNPDPAQTIHAYREMRAAQQSAADGLVTATAALVGATKRLAWATWARPADRGDGREHGLRVDRGAVMASPRIDKVTKVDAARRQISTAIRLFLGRRDTISIHTLVAAAQGSRKEESGGAGRNAWRVLNLADIHIVRIQAGSGPTPV